MPGWGHRGKHNSSWRRGIGCYRFLVRGPELKDIFRTALYQRVRLKQDRQLVEWSPNFGVNSRAPQFLVPSAYP